MIEINRNPSRKALLQFSLIWFPAFCALVGLFLWHRFGLEQPARLVWGGGAVLAVLAALMRPLARGLYLGLTFLTYPIGWVLSHLILFLLFFAVVTPIGLAMRLFGKDPLAKGPDPTRSTYWIERTDPTDPERYFRQS